MVAFQDVCPLERGVRQGCPLSAYLFILTLEMLANKIRADKNVKGIIINNIEVKISLLADLRRYQFIQKCIKHPQHFSALFWSQNKY